MLMAGQVWVDPDGNEILITVGDTRPVAPEDERVYRSGVIIGASTLDRCILVAGPSPWGRDVPWMDTREAPFHLPEPVPEGWAPSALFAGR